MTKKEELYALIKLYKQERYDVDSFCDELSRILFYENNAISELNEHEKEIFVDLSDITNRYSPYEEDHTNCPGAFFKKDAVEKAFDEAYIKLFGK